MTLLEVIRAIEDAAAHQPSVVMIIENDVLRLNSYADARYGAFVWTQGRHRTDPTNPDWIRYSFTLFYIDRLRNDIANQVEVQSVGARCLGAQDLVAETCEVRGEERRQNPDLLHR